MYIDIEKAKREFLNYTNSFDTSDPNINRKMHHSIRVMEVSKEIAISLNINEEDIEIASVIGLLHDIARFEQFTRFHTFNDAVSIDHGDYGVQILENDMRKYIETDKYDDLIKIAIKNHNKFKIENGLTERELFFSKLVRDADKIDIIYESTQYFWEGKEDKISKNEFDPNILNCFYNKQLVNNKNHVVDNDNSSIIRILTFIFDINFSESYSIIKNNDYINKFLDRFDMNDNKEIPKLREFANSFLDSKISF